MITLPANWPSRHHAGNGDFNVGRLAHLHREFVIKNAELTRPRRQLQAISSITEIRSFDVTNTSAACVIRSARTWRMTLSKKHRQPEPR